MRFVVEPATRHLEGTITIPGDKSIGHRALLFSLLSQTPVRVRGLGDGLFRGVDLFHGSAHLTPHERQCAFDARGRRLAAGQLSLHGLLAALDTRWLEGPDLARLDPQGLALANLNTPADLARIEAVLAAPGAPALR